MSGYTLPCLLNIAVLCNSKIAIMFRFTHAGSGDVASIRHRWVDHSSHFLEDGWNLGTLPRRLTSVMPVRRAMSVAIGSVFVLLKILFFGLVGLFAYEIFLNVLIRNC